MSLKGASTALAAKLDDRERFLAEMEALMAGNGMKVDDATTLDKLRALDAKTIASELSTLSGFVKNVKSMAENIAEAVG